MRGVPFAVFLAVKHLSSLSWDLELLSCDAKEVSLLYCFDALDDESPELVLVILLFFIISSSFDEDPRLSESRSSDSELPSLDSAVERKTPADSWNSESSTFPGLEDFRVKVYLCTYKIQMKK